MTNKYEYIEINFKNILLFAIMALYNSLCYLKSVCIVRMRQYEQGKCS